MDAVRLLSLLDYVFIIAGFLLFFSLHSIALRTLAGYGRLVWIPMIGMGLTVCSRLLDALENLWVILIYSNPESYATVLITLMNGSETLKWLVVSVEYPTLGLAIVVVVLVRFTSLFERFSANPTI